MSIPRQRQQSGASSLLTLLLAQVKGSPATAGAGKGMAATGAMHAVQTRVSIPAFLMVHAPSSLAPWLLVPLLGGRLCYCCLVGPRQDVLNLPTGDGWHLHLKREARMYLWSLKL